MKALPTVDLSRIRAHAGAQDRAFEELAYLLAWDLEGLDRGTAIERRATPDGGVEFSCIPDGAGHGGRWAWQAKYLFRFDKSVFAQMSKSVAAALDHTPDLERYIFVLPKDRSTAAIAKWKAAVEGWTEQAKAKGMSVDFEFRGESQLLAALTRDAHAGAIRYFFDETFLTKKFMSAQINREVKNLGERYSPHVNVETEARDIIDAACRGPRFAASLKDTLSEPLELRRSVVRHETSERVILDGGSSLQALLDHWAGVVVASLEHLADPGDAVFRTIEAEASALRNGVEEVEAAVEHRLETLSERSRKYNARPQPTHESRPAKRRSRAQKAEDERVRQRDNLRSFSGSLWRLQAAVDGVIHYLNGDEVAAAASGSVVVVGEAGCGKSHLVADVASERIGQDLPSLLLLGQHFGPGLVDPQIVQMVGLGTLTLGDALQALDVAARIRRTGRALLVIDAVNEGAGADIWESQLPGLIEEVARYPWVALVVTLRDVYESSLLPAGVPAGVTRSVHPGLAGHEEEALALYAATYNLRLPDVPALLPEITNPLFLRSLCQSVQGRGLTAIPREAGSLVWVFDGLIEAVERALRRPDRLDYADWQHKVSEAVSALAGAMVDFETEALPLAHADAVCSAIHSHTRSSKSLLNGLIVEGLLLRETVDRDGSATESIRFTYQRLSDHVRAQVLLDRYATNTALAAAIRNIAKSSRPWAMSGVISALALLVPETRGKEITTILRFGKNLTGERWAHRDPSTWLRGVVQEAFFDTLVWRSPSSFTTATQDLLGRYIDANAVRNDEWLRIISALACVPDHPLNAEWLHPILWRMSLPDRDRAWTRELLWVYSDEMNPVSRTIDWAWANPDAPEDVVRLASVFLTWLFTSTNRRLRDTATKALVSVSTHHPQVLTDLVQRFALVNDPYVLDRVVAVAYGHILRRRHHIGEPSDVDALIRLGQAVYDAVFGSGEPVAHLMLRYRAQMCAEIVDALRGKTDGGLERDLSAAAPPYKTPWPLTAPSASELARGFGRGYEGHLGLATEVDWEFERHLESHVLEYIVLPEQTKARSAHRRNLRRKRDRVLARLVAETATSRKERVRRRAERLLGQSVDSHDVRQAWAAFQASLPKRTRDDARDLHDIVSELDHLDRRVFHPEPSLCIRWVAARMLDLGWTKERFGEGDDRIRQRDGQHVTEPVAKKYERIAFQELCGHLADHCTFGAGWHQESEPYRGPWQIPGATDIDPSLLVRGDEPDADTPASRLRTIRQRPEQEPAWWRTPTGHELVADTSDDAWLGITSDFPRPEAMLKAVDPHGHAWLALERHQEWSVKDHSDLGRSYRPDRRQLWIRLQANIIRADDEDFPPWVANTNWMGLREVATPADMVMAGLGEYPDVGAWPAELDLSDRERRPWDPDDDPGLEQLPMGWELAKIHDSSPAPYALASVGWHLESGDDYSAVDTPGALMPSRVLLGLLDAHWSGGLDDDESLGLGPIEREYSWVSPRGVVAFCTTERGYGGRRVLWVRAEPLTRALADAGLAMWGWVLGEKIYWSGGQPSTDRADYFAGARLAPPPLTVWGFTVERTRGRRRGYAGTRERLLAERCDGIEELPMPKPERRRRLAAPKATDLEAAFEALESFQRK